MIAYPDIPGVTIHPIAPADRAALHCAILPEASPPAADSAAIDHAWSELRHANPRLHNGPILIASRATGSPRFAATRDVAPSPQQNPISDGRTRRSAHVPANPQAEIPNPQSSLSAYRSTYKTLATAPALNPSIRALGVQALLIARDAAGDEHLLLGRRGSEVRMYPGLWENAPSGTVPPPPAAATSIDLSHFLAALIAEGTEELGLDLTTAHTTCIALLDDQNAHSLDVVLRVELPTPIHPLATPCTTDDTHRWEYAATAWVPTGQLMAWVVQNMPALSPSTSCVLRWLFGNP